MLSKNLCLQKSHTLRLLYSSTAHAEKQRIVIIGGVAGGATAAARLNRLSSDVDVTILERSPDVSFANCGLPYYLGGEIRDRSKLALQTPQSLQKQLGVKVHTQTEATNINRIDKVVEARNLVTGELFSLPYDKLILSPGASPIRPNLPNLQLPQVLSLRTLQDMDTIHAALQKLETSLKRSNPQQKVSVAVVGAGFIGLEVAEQLVHRGCQVSLIERNSTVLPQADGDMASFLHAPLQEHGVQLVTGDGLAGIETNAEEELLTVKLQSGRSVQAHLVLLSIGVKPESYLAKAAGLTLNERGYVVVNDTMQTSDKEIYAVGDVTETRDLVFAESLKASVALGNLANMQARIAADHLIQSSTKSATAANPNTSAALSDFVISYPGSLGTSIVRAFDMTLALTGWTETRLKQRNIPYETVSVTAWDHASYYPGALPVTLKICYSPENGRLLGAQATGVQGVDKRIDVLATAITAKLTIDDLSLLQLTYSPPFGAARDVVNIAGLAARNKRDHLLHAATAFDQPALSSNKTVAKPVVLLDVRPKESAQVSPLTNSLNVPYTSLKDNINTIINGKYVDGHSAQEVEFRTVCAWGKTAYFASRELEKVGLTTSTLMGGLQVHRKPLPDLHLSNNNNDSTTSTTSNSAATANVAATTSGKCSSPVHLDCSGLACPGPLLKLQQCVDSLQPGESVRVTATDPGFKADVRAYATSQQLTVQHLTSDKGVITAILMKPTGVNPKENTNNAANTSSHTNNTVAGDRRKGATVVVFSQELDKVLAAFVIANGAAAMGSDVTMFFTFWGLNAIKHRAHNNNDTNTNNNTTNSDKHDGKDKNKGRDVTDTLFNLVLPSSAAHLPLSHFNFGGLGATMMEQVMQHKHLPSLEGLLNTAMQQKKIRMVACTMSMQAMGVQEKDLLPGVELGGVADYLNAAETSGTNLFI